MEGKVIKYFEDKGFGFITDHDGNNRFFHISDVKSTEPISNYCEVEFLPSESEKGMTAKDVFIIPNKKPLFISLGEVRLKLNNIKSYGLTSETEVYEETITLEKDGLEKTMSGIQNTISTLSLLTKVVFGEEMVPFAGIAQSKTDTITHEKVYDILYLTTYQGGNYRFSEKDANFDIHEKIKELDEYFI